MKRYRHFYIFYFFVYVVAWDIPQELEVTSLTAEQSGEAALLDHLLHIVSVIRCENIVGHGHGKVAAIA